MKQLTRFANLSDNKLQQILGQRHSNGTNMKVTNWSLTTFKDTISGLIFAFFFFICSA